MAVTPISRRRRALAELEREADGGATALLVEVVRSALAPADLGT